jgi:hypothetical protein
MQLPPEDARDMSTFNKVPYWLVVEYILVKDGLSDAAVADRHAAIKAIREVRLLDSRVPCILDSCIFHFLFRFEIFARKIWRMPRTMASKLSKDGASLLGTTKENHSG